MHPILLQFSFHGNMISIYAYRFLFVVAVLIAWMISSILIKRAKLPYVRSMSVLLIASLGFLGGARLLHILVNPDLYAVAPTKALALDLNGLSIMGGLMLASAAGLISILLLKLPAWRLADLFTPGLAVAIVIQRIGCFLNGCCFGIKTSLPWGVSYPAGSTAAKYYLQTSLHKGELKLFGAWSSPPLHPTPLYELTAALIGLALAAAILRKNMPAGTAFLVFVIVYSGSRLINNYLRVFPPTFSIDPMYYTYLYIGIIILSAAFMLHRLRQKCYT